MKLIRSFKKTKDFVDPDKDKKDMLTKFVNAYMLPRHVLRTFIEMISDKFKPALAKVRRTYSLKPHQLFFTFKGGNVMNLINLNRKIMLPYMVNMILDIYDPYLRQSDNDFSIYLDPTIESYDEVFDTVSLTAFETLIVLRRHYNANKMLYFPFFSLTLKRRRELMRELADEMDVESVELSERTDIFIAKDDKGDTAVYQYSDTKHLFYSSLNTSLDFDWHGDFKAKFDLARTKVSFKVDDALIGGELIDVSIPHKDDTSIRMESGHWKKFYKENFQIGAGGVRMLSLKYIVEDLLKILFTQTQDKPWIDAKYGKRIARLFYFSLLYMLNQKKITEKRVKELEMKFKDPSKFEDKLMKEVFSKLEKAQGDKEYMKVLAYNHLLIDAALDKIRSYSRGFDLGTKHLHSIDAFSGPI